MSPFAIIALVGILGIGGYVAYDVYQTTQASSVTGQVDSLVKTATSGSSTALDIIDPFLFVATSGGRSKLLGAAQETHDFFAGLL